MDDVVDPPGEDAASDPALSAAPVKDGGVEDGPVASVRQLIADARTAAEREIALAQACGMVVVAALRGASVWGVIAVVTGFVAVLTLAIGLMMALAAKIGMLLATLAVAGALLLITAVAGLLARNAVREMQRAIAMLKQ